MMAKSQLTILLDQIIDQDKIKEKIKTFCQKHNLAAVTAENLKEQIQETAAKVNIVCDLNSNNCKVVDVEIEPGRKSSVAHMD